MVTTTLFTLLACASTPDAVSPDVAANATPTKAPDIAAEAPADAPTPESSGPIHSAADLVLERPPNAGAPVADPESFGDHYMLVEPPTIKGSSVSAKVRYGGGCAEHTWTVADAGGGVWKLVHDGGGDLCKAFLFAEASVNVANEGVDLCGVSALKLEVAVGPQGNPNAVFELPVDEALSRCEGIVPDATAPAEQ